MLPICLMHEIVLVGLYSYRSGNYCAEKILGVFSNANSPDILKIFHSMVICKKYCRHL